MKDLHFSHLDTFHPESFLVNTWLSEIHKELATDREQGDVFFFSLAYFNNTDKGLFVFETREQAFDNARGLGMDVLSQADDIAQAFPVYLRVRKGRVISTGLLGLKETLDWLDDILEARRKTMVLRFADKQCQKVAWYSFEGHWGDTGDPADDDPELAAWLQGVMAAVHFDKYKKKAT